MTTLREAAQRGDFDHGIGADRFKVVRGAFWWHVLIGDSPTEHGKFRSRAGAEKMAADLLREFRNGAFVQHKAALAEPVQEPVQDWSLLQATQESLREHMAEIQRLRAAPPQRKPLTDEEIDRLFIRSGLGAYHQKDFTVQTEYDRCIERFARAIERAHGITGPEDKGG